MLRIIGLICVAGSVVTQPSFAQSCYEKYYTRSEGLMDDIEDISDEMSTYSFRSPEYCRLNKLYLRKQNRYIKARINGANCPNSLPERIDWQSELRQNERDLKAGCN